MGINDISTDPLADLEDACDLMDGSCAGRTHFILHQTVDGKLTYDTVKPWIGKKRNKSHAVILKTGEVVHLWPFQETNVWATKAESGLKPKNGKLPKFDLKGKAINIEIDYEEGGSPNSAQYTSLAACYIGACRTVDRVLTIVPHIEIDRGIPDGHSDPQNFNYTGFYERLNDLGVDMDRVPRFDHDRYWAKESYKVPYADDWFSWPPVLTGDPHAKPKGVERVASPHGDQREWAGMLSKDASFHLVSTGAIGVKEFDRLIRRLEQEREVLAEETEERDEN
ncbi:hypothetical protein [Mesorhizobium sp. M0676]|uniref:hypothetical protein n=1 Tax=Mesorhizobium sp. M0676 TaxID=2956984 RepID=UPI0033365454